MPVTIVANLDGEVVDRRGLGSATPWLRCCLTEREQRLRHRLAKRNIRRVHVLVNGTKRNSRGRTAQPTLRDLEHCVSLARLRDVAFHAPFQKWHINRCFDRPKPQVRPLPRRSHERGVAGKAWRA